MPTREEEKCLEVVMVPDLLGDQIERCWGNNHHHPSTTIFDYGDSCRPPFILLVSATGYLSES